MILTEQPLRGSHLAVVSSRQLDGTVDRPDKNEERHGSHTDRHPLHAGRELSAVVHLRRLVLQRNLLEVAPEVLDTEQNVDEQANELDDDAYEGDVATDFGGIGILDGGQATSAGLDEERYGVAGDEHPSI